MQNAAVKTDFEGAIHPENQNFPEPKARLITFYLPQFHPIPENNQWWGPGFTEWTNVAKAKPLYRGHQQPNIPADLGFYDLRVPEVREAQAKLARDNGIEGFCYWHYWFGNGRRILERPFNEVLKSGKPDFPFCLAWANQSWTGIWHGSPKTVLIEQKYPGKEDEKAHFDAMLPAFRDKRYMRMNGKLIFVIFDLRDHPNIKAFIEHWQLLAKSAGLPGFYFVGMDYKPYIGDDSLDAITSNEPGDFLSTQQTIFRKILKRLKTRNFGSKINRFTGNRLMKPIRYDYNYVVEKVLNSLPKDSKNSFYIPCILPNWDNTPRSGARGYILENSTPELFRKYLSKAVALVSERPREQRIIFIKAWNEWAEGNYVEPDTKYGHAYLEAIKAEMFPGKA